MIDLKEVAAKWGTAIENAPDSAARLKALSRLAMSRSQLPGPIFFLLEPAARGDYPDLVEESMPLCRCGMRRLLAPNKSVEFQPQSDQITVEPLRPLIVGPEGGDFAASCVRLLVTQGGLSIVRMFRPNPEMYRHLYSNRRRLWAPCNNKALPVVDPEKAPGLTLRLGIGAVTVPLLRVEEVDHDLQRVVVVLAAGAAPFHATDLSKTQRHICPDPDSSPDPEK